MERLLLGEESVLEGVQSRYGSTCFGGWAGGALGVAAIGGELFLREDVCHKKEFLFRF